jgi:hypothetical protein
VRVSLQRAGQSATVVDKLGAEAPLEPGQPVAGAPATWTVTLPGATRHFNLFGGDPPGYFYVGGSPLLVVERGVPADAPFTRVAVL